MKAANESESLEHMAAMFGTDELLSGRNQLWTNEKVLAMRAIYRDYIQDPINSHVERGTALPFHMLDLGIGDMLYLKQWPDFGDIRYTGVDGSQVILDAARFGKQEGNAHSYVLSTFSAFLDNTWKVTGGSDLIASVDTLYHIPEDEIHDRMLTYLLGGSYHRYALFSFATDMSQKFDQGTGVGTAGFSWFPREFKAELLDGWDILYQADQPKGMQQSQRLLALVRL